MTRMLLLSVASLLILTGCAQTYIITLQNGNRITAKGKPHLVNGWYVYKDAKGQKTAVKAISIHEIAPASMVTDPNAAFKPVSSK